MKPFLNTLLLLLILAAPAGIFAQSAASMLATADGIKITSSDLSSEARDVLTRRDEIIAANRTRFLERTIAEKLLEIEGRGQGISGEEVLRRELEKLPKPAESQIKAVFDANRTVFGDRPLESVRVQIVGFLMQEDEEKAEKALIERLRTKHKIQMGTPVNKLPRKPADVLFILEGKHYSIGEFEKENRIALNDVEVHIYEEIRAGVEDALLTKLIEKEAAALNVDAGSVIASEITDKMREFSDAERISLWDLLQSRLFKKYSAKILLPEPEPLVLNVSADDDRSFGPAAAPVTVVMFNDFQCSACASFGPIVKSVVEKFGDKVRLVIRDFPLESIHENAFNAALAANAAALQGKYFEYGALLYANQSSLDEATLLRLAGELKLDMVRFKADMADPKNAAEIRKDIVDGKSYGVGGTPTIYINGVKHHGLTEPKLRSAIEKALNRVK